MVNIIYYGALPLVAILVKLIRKYRGLYFCTLPRKEDEVMIARYLFHPKKHPTLVGIEPGNLILEFPKRKEIKTKHAGHSSTFRDPH